MNIAIELSESDAAVARICLPDGVYGVEEDREYITQWMDRRDAQVLYGIIVRQDNQARGRLTNVSYLRSLRDQIDEAINEYS